MDVIYNHNILPQTIYFNNTGILIPEASLADFTSYIKVCSDSEGTLKTLEFVDDNTITAFEYFLSDGESHTAVFNQYPAFDSIRFYTNKVKSGRYAKYEVLRISRAGKIEEKRIQIFGDTLLPLYDQAIDIESGSTIYLAKHFYALEKNISFEFEYETATGNLVRITVYDPENRIDTDDHTILPAQVGKGKNPYNFNWDGFEYYKQAAPVLPNE